jgi:uncharacterized protein
VATYRLEPAPWRDRTDIIAGDPAERQHDKLLLGYLAESGPRRNLWLDITGEQVIAVLGKRGSGKSYTLGTIIEGLAAGEGNSAIASLNTPRAALVFDIMDIFWSSQILLTSEGPAELMKQFEIMKRGGFTTQPLNIEIWIPSGFENPQIDPPHVCLLEIRACDLEIDDWGSLFEVDIFGEPRGMLISEVITHVARTGYTASEDVDVPANPNFDLSDLLNCLAQDVEILANYREDTIRSVRQRLSTYAALPLFAGDGTSLATLLPPFQATVLMLARVPDALKKVIVAVLTRRILRERRDASLAQKRMDLDSRLDESQRDELKKVIRSKVPRMWLLMDEAHVLAGVDEPSVAREAMVKYAKEGRNYGLSLALATQQPSALDSRLMSQVETAIVHQLTDPRDAAVAKNAMRSPLPSVVSVDGEAADVTVLLRRLSQGVATFSCGNAPSLTRFCVTAIRPRISAHGGYEA